MNGPDAETRELARQAERLARRGDMPAASAAYRALLARAPEHAGALAFLSAEAFARGALADAERFARAACNAAPEDAILAQNLGLVLGRLGRLEAAREALSHALELQPDFATAQLHYAALLEQSGDTGPALEAYARAFRLDPGLERLAEDPAASPVVRGPVRRALAARRRAHRAMHQDIVASVAAAKGRDGLDRIAAFLRIFHGEEQPDYAHPLQKPDWQYFPGLPPRAFFEREEFDWIDRLEAGWRPIRDELVAVLAADAGVEPYVPGLDRPPELWRGLAGSLDWSAFQLLKGGRPVPENVARCPGTMAVIEGLDLANAPPHTPEAFFSILKPGTHIPPHYGLSNFKLAVHLALIIPESCGIRVGDETRHWEEGRCLVFDDSFEHEAWNRSNTLRAVLIVEAWNPALTGIERAAIGRIIAASEHFNAQWAA